MKVLIISHTSMNTHNNMGKTLVSLFSAFEKHELCQLYIYPMIPDIDMCESYYRITDKDVLKGCYQRQVRGREIDSGEVNAQKHDLYENPDDRKLYRNPKNKNALRILLRDLMWKCAPWYNDDLEKWIVEQQPTCIFVAPGIPRFLYDITLKISEKFHLPIVTYICDDYYSAQTSDGILGYVKQKLLMKKTEKLLGKTAHLISICDGITEQYGKRFQIPATTIMTGASCPIATHPAIYDTVSVMTYMGNIGYNRYVCLAEIGKVLDEINANMGTDYQLHIYTIESRPEILQVFDGISSIKLCGFVCGDEYDAVFSQAQILVHTEAFDENSMQMTKNSVSTKIADSLASGIPLFAYGPEQIASISHLIRNDCAVVVTEKDELKETVRKMFVDSTFRYSKVHSGLETARCCHSGSGQSEKLKRILTTVG